MTQPLTVVLSGAMGGIGQAAAQRLASDGHRLYLLYHTTPQEEVNAFVRSLQGADHFTRPCDLSDAEATASVIAEAHATMGSIDACIHAATGRIVRKRPSAMTPAEFRDEFDVSLFGAFAIFSAAVPYMKKTKRGRIIALTTAGIEREASPGAMAGYLSAKAALRQLLHDLSDELRSTGVTVNAIAPSFVATPLQDDLPAPVRSFLGERAGVRPETIADLIARLCSPECAEITGMSFSAQGEPSPL